MPERLGGTSSRPVFRDGWGWFLLATVSRAYLVCLLSLAAIAILPALLGWHGSVVQSGSMRPHIDVGDVVLASELPQESAVPIGRVVEFDSPAAAEPGGRARIRLHRIVASNDDGTYVTAGDANQHVDSTAIVRGQIIGQGRLLVPFVGLPSLWIGSGNVAAFAAWVALTLAALVAVAADVPGAGRTRGRRRHGTGGGAGEGEGAVQPVAQALMTRRALLTVAGGIVITGLAAVPRDPLSASFSARTTMAGSSWTVATVAPLTLGRAGSYALLAGSKITIAGLFTFVTGSIGTSTGTSVTGVWPWTVSGSTDINNAVARDAKTDAVALYATANSRPTTATRSPTLTGTVYPGVYASTSGAFTSSGILTLDARGDSSAVFVFKATTLTALAYSTVNLTNGAAAGNVYWRIGNTITLGSGSAAKGNYLAAGNVTMQSGANLTGRLISLNGTVAVDNGTVALPG